MADKEDKCWPGYEPVKGKPPHSEGSCRPKAKSKLTPSEKEFRGKRRRQLDRWQADHRDTLKSASQHLPAAGKKTRKKSSAKNASKKKPTR